MRTFDFIIQTMLLSAAVFVLFAGREAIIWIGIIQFFVGCWQVISGIANAIAHGSLNDYGKRNIKIYWLLVLFYFLGLGLTYITKLSYVWGTWFFLAWGLAIYYYVFTIKLAFPSNKGGDKKSFLDIAN